MEHVLWDAERNEPAAEGVELADDLETSGDFFRDYALAVRLLRVLPCPSLAHTLPPVATAEERAALEKAVIDATRQRQRKSRAAAAAVTKRRPIKAPQQQQQQAQQVNVLQPAPTSAVRVRIVGHVVDAGTARAMTLALAAATSPQIELSFERVRFARPELATALVAAAAPNPNVVALAFEGAPLPLPLLQLFEPLFAPSSRVARLSLRGSPLGDELARDAIPELLRKAPGIAELDLSGTGIGDVAATAIAVALRRNTTLLQLSLSRNRIGDAGAAELAAALGRFPLSYEEQRAAWEKRSEFENRKTSLLAAKQSRLSKPKTPVTPATPTAADSSASSPGGEQQQQQQGFGLSIKARKRQEQQQLEQLEQQIAALSPLEERGGQWIVRGNRTLLGLWLSGNRGISPAARETLTSVKKDNNVLTILELQ